MEIPEYNSLNKNNIREKYIKKHYYEFFCFLIDNYPDCASFIEKLYCFYHNINKVPICPLCGKNTNFYGFKRGYSKFCSNECSNNSNETKEKFKNTMIKKFGSYEKYIEYHKKQYKEKTKDKPIININKAKQTCLKKYGVDSYTKTEEYKIKSKQTHIERYGVDNYTKTEEYKIKTKQTKLQKYGNEKFTNIEKHKRTCLLKYGVDNISKTKHYKDIMLSKKDDIVEKIYQTKKQNNTFNSSKIEKQFEEYLKENNINYKKQYKSEIYPFNCDFYLTDKDLYIEINAHWTHGGHPFDSTNKEDQLQLESWKQKGTKFYDNAIKTWSERDVLKRETAKKNKLNYLEVFTNEIDYTIDSLSTN